MEWINKGYKTLEEFMKKENGVNSKNEFLHPPISNIQFLKQAVNMMVQSCLEKRKITIIGDYDVDGILSSLILARLLIEKGNTPIVRLPRRFSEGYGLSDVIVNEVIANKTTTGELIITIDNGIKSIDKIQRFTDAGFKVIVMDHHLPEVINGQIVLPPADVVVDPHVHGGGYIEYCAAGLAFKAAVMAECSPEVFYEAVSLAAIATISDVVSLTGDNRNIVITGLSVMNSCNCPMNIRHMLLNLNITHIDENTIAYTLGPLINSAGRVFDKGAEFAYHVLFTDNSAGYIKMSEINNERKKLVETCFRDICSTDMSLSAGHPIVVTSCKHLGIAGIIAGKLAETYGVPAIVLTNLNNGFYKGSARSIDGISIIDILRNNDRYIYQYGGHDGAAGLTIESSKISGFIKSLSNLTYPSENVISYDMEISVEELSEMLAELQSYAPYGEGNKRPLFRMTFEASPKYGSVVKEMADGKYGKFFSNEGEAVAFEGFVIDGKSVFQRWKDMGRPYKFQVLAYISRHIWNSINSIQIEIQDVKKIEEKSSEFRRQLLDKMEGIYEQQ